MLKMVFLNLVARLHLALFICDLKSRFPKLIKGILIDTSVEKYLNYLKIVLLDCQM